MKDITKPKNIILIRSATNILNATIESLKNEFPDSKITVLAPESAKESLTNHQHIDTMISVGKINRMSLLSVNNESIRKMRYGKFDLAVSLYNIDHGMGYSNIDLLAWASGAKTIRGYNASGKFTEFNGWSVLKKYFLEKTSFAWVLVNGLTTIILFSFITLGLLCEWTVRKLLSIILVKKKTEIPSQKIVIQQYEKCSTVPQGLSPKTHQKI